MRVRDPEDRKDTTRTTSASPIFDANLRLQPGGSAGDDHGAATTASGPILATLYRKADNSIIPQGSLPHAQNLVVTVRPDRLNPGRARVRITRQDHTIQVISPSPDGIALDLAQFEPLRVRGGNLLPPRYVRVTTDASVLATPGYEPGTELRALLDAARAAYGGLRTEYHENTVSLPGFEWSIEDGLTAALRILRVNPADGRAIHPYRRYFLRFSGENTEDLLHIRVGQWFRHRFTIPGGQRYDVTAPHREHRDDRGMGRQPAVRGRGDHRSVQRAQPAERRVRGGPLARGRPRSGRLGRRRLVVPPAPCLRRQRAQRGLSGDYRSLAPCSVITRSPSRPTPARARRRATR